MNLINQSRCQAGLDYAVPCYSCAPGKSILAALPKDELDGYLSKVTFKKVYTQNTLTTSTLLIDDLEKVRTRGYGLI